MHRSDYEVTVLWPGGERVTILVVASGLWTARGIGRSRAMALQPYLGQPLVSEAVKVTNAESA